MNCHLHGALHINGRFYDVATRTYARTVKESWKLEPDSGMPNKEFFVHLYRFPGADEDEMTELAATVAEILKFKADKREAPPELWRIYRCCIKVLPATEGRKKKRWYRNDEAIREAVQYAGMFVIRNNLESDPFLRCTSKSYMGKLFVCTIAASLRLMMMSRAQTNANAWVVRQLSKGSAICSCCLD